MTTDLPVPETVFSEMVRVRRDLHRHPELSWDEHRTADVLQTELGELGLTSRRVGGTGVVVDLPGPEGVPRVALRADTDALPVQEETGLAFSSVNDGVMHACGHDGHSSMLLGAAALLRRGPLPAPVRLIWQPAEEQATGARALIEGGCLEDVGLIFGGHIDRRYDAGQLVVTDGPVNASTDTFAIELRGRAGHGARPHEAVDTVVIGSALVMALQTIVSREINPAHPAVLSVGIFQAGQAPNIIAGQARLEGTLRTQDPAVREQLRQAVVRIAESVGAQQGARVSVSLTEGTPPLKNAPGPTSIARSAAVEIVGLDRVVPLACANMGGDDFAFFLRHVPGCYIRFGARPPGGEDCPAHSGRFDFDETALATGAAWFVAVARRGAEALAAQHPGP